MRRAYRSAHLEADNEILASLFPPHPLFVRQMPASAIVARPLPAGVQRRSDRRKRVVGTEAFVRVVGLRLMDML